MSANNPQPTESNASTASSTQAAPAITRCRATNRSGRRCRLHANPHSGFCPRHALRPIDQPEGVDLSRHFGTQLDDLSTAFHINDFITTLVRLLVKNEISSRRAAVIGYLTNQLLRSVPAVDRELNPVPDESQIILDLPRPQSTDEPAPDAHPVAAATTTDSAPVVAGLQTRSFPADAVIPSLPVAGGRSSLPASGGRDLLLSSSPPPQTTTLTTPPPTPKPNPDRIVLTNYHDPTYDHWFPTASVIKTAAEIERKRFAPNPDSPHHDAKPGTRKPACAGRPAA